LLERKKRKKKEKERRNKGKIERRKNTVKK